MKTIRFLFICICAFMITNAKVSALTINSTYNNLSSTSDITHNLLNYAISYDSFYNSKYVIFQDGQYSYYIVWGDLHDNNGTVTGDAIEYIHYYRTSESSGYNYTYSYDYGTDTNFTLSSEYTVISNLNNYGITSEIYRLYNFNNLCIQFLIFISAFLFVIMVRNLRRS